MTRRAEIFDFICDYASLHSGNSPSMRDLLTVLHKAGYKMHLSTLREHMKQLEVEGRLHRSDGKLIVDDSQWTPPDEVAPTI
jgi:hypothetical protein